MSYLVERIAVSWGLLLGAAGVDFGLGDPWHWPHPVQLMGGVIQGGQAIILARVSVSWGRRLAGCGLAVLVILGSAWIGGGVVWWGASWSEWLGGAIALFLLASCFAGRSLRQAAEDVLHPLERGELSLARSRLSRYVGRDTEQLSVAEVYRAIFETVTENAVDGVLAPLFFAVVGSLVGALWRGHGAWLGMEGISDPLWVWMWVLPVMFALAYKAASTLDSMVGYRTEPYRDLGWFSARLEDVLTWLPCRLAVLSIALLSGALGERPPGAVIRICRRDARQDPSPNSGWSECVYAAALGVQVGGDNYYQGVLKCKPWLGDNHQPITLERIQRALELTRLCFLLWLLMALLFLLLIFVFAF